MSRAPLVSRSLRAIYPSPFFWDMRLLSVCSSTELILSKWLKADPYLPGSQFPRAVLSFKQRHGKGQNGRIWESQQGGVWISAAFPWIPERKSSGLMGLSIALALSERIERYDLPVRIKWPNDLVIEGRKIAGLLPGLIHRGSDVRFARVGLGLNVFNKVPKEGISLRELLGPGKSRLTPWTVEVFLALEKAILFSRNVDWLCEQIEKRLWAKQYLDKSSGLIWNIKGISHDGGLKVFNSSRDLVLKRWS